MKNVRKTTKKAGGGKMTKPKSKSQAFEDYRKKHGSRHKADPKHAMNAESTRPRRKAGGGAMKKKGYSKGGKLKMVEKNGKKVPFFAADGVGKMAKGGSMRGAIKAGQKFKKPGESMEDMMIRVAKEQGVFKKKGGGSMKKKGYAKGGSVDPKKVMNPTKYKIKSGDTLSQIAKKYGTSVKAIMAANPKIKNANSIRAGAGLTIPGGVKSKTKNPYKGQTSKEITTGKMAPSKPKRKVPSMRQAKPSGGLLSNLFGKSKTKPKVGKPTKPTAKKKAAPSMSGLRAGDVAAKRGGMMKKKGYKKGGTVRGAGAATRGKRFGRSA